MYSELCSVCNFLIASEFDSLCVFNGYCRPCAIKNTEVMCLIFTNSEIFYDLEVALLRVYRCVCVVLAPDISKFIVRFMCEFYSIFNIFLGGLQQLFHVFCAYLLMIFFHR